MKLEHRITEIAQCTLKINWQQIYCQLMRFNGLFSPLGCLLGELHSHVYFTNKKVSGFLKCKY